VQYRRIGTQGTYFVPAAVFGAVLTSKELKVKTKQANVAGLQLADLIAHPAYRALQADNSVAIELPPFAAQVHRLLREKEKYVALPGQPDFGRKWLPAKR
jgi:hypothetical protein